MSDTHGQTNAHSCTLTHADALTLKHTHTSMQHHYLKDTTEINKNINIMNILESLVNHRHTKKDKTFETHFTSPMCSISVYI